MRYVGQMKTTYLNDKQIRPTEYKKWAHASRHFERNEKDRMKVQGLKNYIRAKGQLPKPIKLGVSDRYPDVYVGDGHHRAIALMELGIETFPFHWYWIRSWGKPQMETGPFPSGLLDR